MDNFDSDQSWIFFFHLSKLGAGEYVVLINFSKYINGESNMTKELLSFEYISLCVCVEGPIFLRLKIKWPNYKVLLLSEPKFKGLYATLSLRICACVIYKSMDPCLALINFCW